MALTNKGFLGWLCIHGHEYMKTGKSVRYKVGNHKCIMCHTYSLMAWKAANKERWAGIAKRSRDKPKNKLKAKKYMKVYNKNVAKRKELRDAETSKRKDSPVAKVAV